MHVVGKWQKRQTQVYTETKLQTLFDEHYF